MIMLQATSIKVANDCTAIAEIIYSAVIIIAPPDVTVLDTNITASADHTFFIVIESTLKGGL